MKEVYLAIKKILLGIADPVHPDKSFFKTVKIDKGQFERIINTVQNDELPYRFPAVFIHFTNVSYLTSQNRTDEGRGVMRVRFILNRLNDQDDRYETEIFDVADLVNTAIQDAKDLVDEEGNPIIKEKMARSYFDMPQSSNQLQPCWIDYDITFTDTKADRYRNWIEKYIITPRFTNWSDVEGSEKEDVEVKSIHEQIQLKIGE